VTTKNIEIYLKCDDDVTLHCLEYFLLLGAVWC